MLLVTCLSSNVLSQIDKIYLFGTTLHDILPVVPTIRFLFISLPITVSLMRFYYPKYFKLRFYGV